MTNKIDKIDKILIDLYNQIYQEINIYVAGGIANNRFTIMYSEAIKVLPQMTDKQKNTFFILAKMQAALPRLAGEVSLKRSLTLSN